MSTPIGIIAIIAIAIIVIAFIILAICAAINLFEV